MTTFYTHLQTALHEQRNHPFGVSVAAPLPLGIGDRSHASAVTTAAEAVTEATR